MQSLRNLRLTSSTLNRAASLLLFEVLVLRSPKGIKRRLRLLCSQHAPLFRVFSVEWPSDRLQVFLADLSRDLHTITRNLPNLIEIMLVRGTNQEIFITKGAVDNLHDVLANLFTFGRLDGVETLCISLPVVSTFDYLVNSPRLQRNTANCQTLKNVMKRIRNLAVDFFPISSGETPSDALLYKEELPLPNTEYEEGYFKFVELATDVEDLSLGGWTDEFFHMSYLNIRTYRCLARISLDYLNTTTEKLQALMLQNRWTLIEIQFFAVALTSGTWEVILRSMMSLAHLTELSVSLCRYERSGDSGNLGCHPSETVSTDIYSLRKKDHVALEILRKNVEHNRLSRTDLSD